MSSNSPELLTKGGGEQSEAEKRKPEGASSDRLEREIKTFFDVGTDWIGSLYPKIPDGSEI